MSAAANDSQPGHRTLRRTALAGLSVTAALLLSACGGAQPQAPALAPAMAPAPALAPAPQVPAPAKPSAPAPVQAPVAQAVATDPEAPPYAYLWEEALKRRPWPHKVPLDPAETPDAAGAHAQNASVVAPNASAPLPDDPDPYHAVPPNLDIKALKPYLQGIASWYGPTFHGKRTANGEIYNQYGLTAAHPVLPIGTKIEVENLENHRRVWVRINDRGPYAKGRILDLSKIAAEQLGMIKDGTAPVRITVLQWPDTVNPNLGLKAYTQYVVQAAAYPDIDEAENLRERLQARFPQQPVMIDIASNGFFAVAVGPFDEESAARALSRQLQHDGMTNLVRRYRN